MDAITCLLGKTHPLLAKLVKRVLKSAARLISAAEMFCPANGEVTGILYPC